MTLVASWVDTLPKDGTFCAVSGNLGTSETETPNHAICAPYFDGTALDRYGIIDGERALVFNTEIHRKYPYPTFPNEKFMTEAVAWNRMAADGYKIRFFNDIIWVYEYKEDGLTKAGSSLFVNNPKGYGLWLREKAKFQGSGIAERLRMYYTFTCDLSLQHTSRQIASFIGAPYPLISVINTFHKLIHLFRK